MDERDPFVDEQPTQPLQYVPLALEAAAYRAELAAQGLVEES